MLSVTSQTIIDGLYTYVFGYINPVDGTTLIPMYQRTYKRSILVTLPALLSPATSIECFVEVITPNGAAKTYF
jgi:hypothetical protein